MIQIDTHLLTQELVNCLSKNYKRHNHTSCDKEKNRAELDSCGDRARETWVPRALEGAPQRGAARAFRPPFDRQRATTGPLQALTDKSE